MGKKLDSYVIVKGSTPEFDYPKGKDNIYATYDGTGGVPIGGFLRRNLFAWHFGDINLLLSSYITVREPDYDSPAISRERVRAIAPFLRLDRDPYLVISSGQAVLDTGRIYDERVIFLMHSRCKEFGSQLHSQFSEGRH